MARKKLPAPEPIVSQPLHKKLLPALAALAVAVGALLAAPPARADVVNEVVLRINERVLTLYDYLQARAEARAEVLRATQLTPEEQERLLAEVPRRVMRTIFQEMLLESRADQLEVFVPEEEIDAEIRRMREDMELGTQEQFLAALEQSGLSEEKLRRQVETTLRVQRVLGEEVSSQIDVSEDELRRYYRAHPDEFSDPARVRVREIVVLDTSALDSEARQLLAQQLKERLAAGESLDDLAADYAPEGVTSNVIELGWVTPGELAPRLEQAVWGLDAGSVSEPVEARGGVHILEVMEREEQELRPFGEVRDEISSRERNRRYGEVFERYLDDLAQSAYVVERIPADAVGYRQAPDGPSPLNEPFKIVGEEPRPRRTTGAVEASAEPAEDPLVETDAPAPTEAAEAEETVESVDAPENVPGEDEPPLERLTGEDPTPDDPLDNPPPPV
ncbi:MAG: peptidyl-prolyl cis-trans isomerase [Acidobacteriota bacterium]|nr:peptidyl-prolyl cis-trans isomerase [Acidobacteriota bacterium]